MVRADNVICGTSTTGTGTLTLAACPSPPGGLDFDKWLKATGIGFASGNAIMVSYTIIEYTSSAFTTAKSTEKGIGTLTLGAAIANATLARTKVQSTVTGMDTSTPTPTFSAPTAFSIGTAANTLVFIGASAVDLMGFNPYYETVLGDNVGVRPMIVSGALTNSSSVGPGVDLYNPFLWATPMLVKRASMRINSNPDSGTSNAYFRIYDVGTDGRPGRLLIDLGLLGTANQSFIATGIISTALHANGHFLMPGEYYANFYVDAETIGPFFSSDNNIRIQKGMTHGMVGFVFNQATATSGSPTAPATANQTGYALTNSYGQFAFALNSV